LIGADPSLQAQKTPGLPGVSLSWVEKNAGPRLGRDPSKGRLQDGQDDGVHHVVGAAAAAEIVAGLGQALEDGAAGGAAAKALGDLVADEIGGAKTTFDSAL